MKKIIISTDYFNEKKYNINKFIQILLQNNDFHYLIMTRDVNKGEKLVNSLIYEYNLNCSFLKRNSKNISSDFEFIIGNKDKDFELATNRKKIIFYDSGINSEEKVKKYGIPFNLEKLNKILKIANLIKIPYRIINLAENINVISLINARYKDSTYKKIEEKDLVREFELFLKKGKIDISSYFIMIYVILAIKSLDLKNPDFIFYYPSSKKADDDNEHNSTMQSITEKLRNLYHLNIKVKPLLTRKYTVTASKEMSRNDRVPCNRHFESILYNDEYSLENKNVWFLDDYCTNGTSFEVVRNFLKDKNLNSLTLISIGNFGLPYIKQEYKNIYDNPEIIDKKLIYNDKYSEDYVSIIDELLKIINA